MKSAMKIPCPRILRDGPRWSPLDFRYHKSRMMLRLKRCGFPSFYATPFSRSQVGYIRAG